MNISDQRKLKLNKNLSYNINGRMQSLDLDKYMCRPIEFSIKT